MVDFFKSFAAPIATITASIVAGTIAVYFALHQKNIAFQQKEIAKEKLRLDLFDRRYKIYESIFDYYGALIGWSGTDEQQVVSTNFFRATKEANFLFGEEVGIILKRVLEKGSRVKGFKKDKDQLKSDPEFFSKEYLEINRILMSEFSMELDELTRAAQRYIGFQKSGLSEI